MPPGNHLHPKHSVVQRLIPRILPLRIRPSPFPPNLRCLLQRPFLTLFRNFILVQQLHDFFSPSLCWPDSGSRLGLFLDWLVYRLSDLALVVLQISLLLLELFSYVGVAVEEGAQVDSAAFAKAVGVVCGWSVGDAAAGADVSV